MTTSIPGPVLDPEAYVFLVDLYRQHDDTAPLYGETRETARTLWLSQFRDDAGGIVARGAMRALLRKYETYDGFDARWLA